MKSETVQAGVWYKIYSDSGEYLGQVMQRLGSCNRPLGVWGFGVGDDSASFGHRYPSARAAAEALEKRVVSKKVSHA